MDKVIESVTACLNKPDAANQSNMGKFGETEKKTEQDKTERSGLVWRLGNGLYSAGANATSAALNGAKWAASTTYNISNSVVGGGVNKVRKMTGYAKEKSKSE